MACFYPGDCCGQYAVTPTLVAPCYPTQCCEDPPMCYPCLPQCPPMKVTYCYETKPPYTPPRTPTYDEDYNCCMEPPQKHKPRSPSRTCKQSRAATPETCPTCHSTCKPVKIKCCYEKKSPCTPPRTPACDEDNTCCMKPSRKCKPCCPPRCRKQSHAATSEPCPTCQPTCKPVKTEYVIPCYRYEDGRIVQKLPVTAFKRNGMQDQEHSKMLGTTNFLIRCPRDVVVECEMCMKPVKVIDPVKVPPCTSKPTLGCCLLKKKPIKVSLADILDD